jgi:organic hydroperoxide reductase OsmC/OhrA
MSTLKDFRFTVDVVRDDDRTVSSTAAGKPTLAVATPPEFRGGIPGTWSPEELLVAASASCFALTLGATAEWLGVPIRVLEIGGAGHVTRRADGRFGFVGIELAVTLTTDEGFEEEARKAARLTEARCLIDRALTVPVEIELSVKTADSAALGAVGAASSARADKEALSRFARTYAFDESGTHAQLAAPGRR